MSNKIDTFLYISLLNEHCLYTKIIWLETPLVFNYRGEFNTIIEIWSAYYWFSHKVHNTIVEQKTAYFDRFMEFKYSLKRKLLSFIQVWVSSCLQSF